MKKIATIMIVAGLVINTAALVTIRYSDVESLFSAVVDFAITIKPAPNEPKTPALKKIIKPVEIKLRSKKVKNGSPLNVKIERTAKSKTVLPSAAAPAKKQKTAELTVQIRNTKNGKTTTIQETLAPEIPKTGLIEKKLDTTALLGPGNYVAVLSFNDEDGVTTIDTEEFEVESDQKAALSAAVLGNQLALIALLIGTLGFAAFKKLLRHYVTTAFV